MEVFDQNRRADGFRLFIGRVARQSSVDTHCYGFLLTSRDETSSIPSPSSTGFNVPPIPDRSPLFIPHGFLTRLIPSPTAIIVIVVEGCCAIQRWAMTIEQPDVGLVIALLVLSALMGAICGYSKTDFRMGSSLDNCDYRSISFRNLAGACGNCAEV
jgi:hypothetical protein